mgnify:FL=1
MMRRALLRGLAGVTAAWAAAGGTVAAAEQEKKPEAEKKPDPPVDLRGLFKMHYENRVRAFREQNALYRNVVLLGDSITEGFDPAVYLPGRRVLNRGIGGDVIGNGLPADDPRGVLRRLDASVFDCAASDVFLMIGINDLNSGHSVDQMETGYREILTRIKERAPAVRVRVQSLLPTRGQYAHQNGPVREFNRRLERLAADHGYPYLDLHARFRDGDGLLKAEFTPDGLHLTERGYQEWRKEILKVWE